MLDRVLLGLVLGIAGFVWIAVYRWAGHPEHQALMIFVSIISATRAVSTAKTEGQMEAHHEF